MTGYVGIGDAWIRVDQIAAVTRWEVVMIGGATVPLGDDVDVEDVLQRIRIVSKAVGGSWRTDGGVVGDGPADLR